MVSWGAGTVSALFANALGAEGGVRIGILTCRSGLGAALGGVGTDFRGIAVLVRGIAVLVRGTSGLGSGCGTVLGCGQETSWTAMGGVSTGVGRGDVRIPKASTTRMPDSRIRASRKTTALDGCGLGVNTRLFTAAPHGWQYPSG